jgi:membrane protease YdiL (CAAX protease family)
MPALGLRRIASFYIALVAMGLAGLALLPGGVGAMLPRSGEGWIAALALGSGVGLAMVGASRLLVRSFSWAARLAGELRLVLGELGWAEALGLALLSGVGEEVLFRGLLQHWLGLWLAALVFGLLHVGPNRHFWPWTLMALGAGLIFGLMFIVTGDLVAPALAHATVNFLNLRFLALTDRRPYVHLGLGGEEGQAARSAAAGDD